MSGDPRTPKAPARGGRTCSNSKSRWVSREREEDGPLGEASRWGPSLPARLSSARGHPCREEIGRIGRDVAPGRVPRDRTTIHGGSPLAERRSALITPLMTQQVESRRPLS